MVLTAGGFALLLQSLGLSQGLSKPSPGVRTGASPVQSKAALTSADSSVRPNGVVVPTDPTITGAGGRINDAASNCMVDPYDAYDWGYPGFPPFDQAKANVYRYRQQQSVNLGSWFVHEQWMTPSLFACASGDQLSELDIASGWGSLDVARSVLEKHWDTFVNISDFDYLAGIGINTVRLPIGYWSLGPVFCQGTPFEPVAEVYQNSWSRVIRAINMAGDAGLGVLVDLHGAPGSQNGQPHSGISDGEVNLFDDDSYINKTMSVLTFLMEELVNTTNVVGIQILNEPSNADSLPAFYTQAISTMRQISLASETFPLYIHDGFNLAQYSDFVANRSDFVVLDHHSYFVFTPGDVAEPASEHTKDIRGSISDALAAASSSQRRNLVIDEFSCALTDQSLAGETSPDQARQDFCQGQMDIYQNLTAGWAFWAYDKEDCYDDPGWCFKAAVNRSLSSTFFSYGDRPVADPSSLSAMADVVSMATTSPQEDPTSMDVQNPPGSYTPPVSSTAAVGLFPYSARSRIPPGEVLDGSTSLAKKGLDGRDDSDPLPSDPSERAISKGYSDGFVTAKIFALYGMSKLGFTGQYIVDSLAKLGTEIIAPGTEHYYVQWFMEGLADGEALIASAVADLP
ncbi:hypothetical protein NUW54_g2568 [Trametes sanguinea]|uniref:Uncharacterized protein n=1 Tax=Trametes sanguinea TaxID=158606 RepID=A0ACC1Q4V4_9APHY|nr:hypothetical protein NUW54_g2568 [Trametes sanguinea]